MKNAVKGALVTVAAAGVITGGAGAAFASSHSAGDADCSPGVGSGNNVQVPVHVPVNVSGISANVIGLLNPAFGNGATNAG
ncbi:MULTISPECIES: chaplin [Streptacidiphilus]|uniref:Chaplin n=2 Tax=Streptacidiphilus TaxID=228398 RepID=A0ABV6UFT9_9ACTN|nr:chaplin [Streptacidiphilus jeojiense]